MVDAEFLVCCYGQYVTLIWLFGSMATIISTVMILHFIKFVVAIPLDIIIHTRVPSQYIQFALRVQEADNYILAQNLYYKYSYLRPKYLTVGYLDPKP